MQRAPTNDTDNPDLASARALVIGLGGLGSPAVLALGRAGVGTLGLVDPDRVDPSNLPRQVLYDDADVGHSKVEAAARRLAVESPGVHVEGFARRFGPSDAGLLHGWDVVLDGTDTVTAKFVVSDAAVAAGVPLVHAGAVGWRAQITTVLAGRTACYRCLFEDPPPPDETPSCGEAGILGPLVDLAGTLQAAEALRILAGRGPMFAGRLLTIDLETGAWRSVPTARRRGCAACGVGREPTAVGRSMPR